MPMAEWFQYAILLYSGGFYKPELLTGHGTVYGTRNVLRYKDG